MGDRSDLRRFDHRGHRLMAGVLVLATSVARRILKRAVRRAFELRGVSDEGTIGLVSNVVGYSVLMVGLGSALSRAWRRTSSAGSF